MSALPAEAGPFLDAIAANPDDPQTRLVFADWLADRDLRGAAAAQRWLAEGFKPAFYSNDELPWTWFVWDQGTLAYWERYQISPRGLLPRGVAVDLTDRGGQFFSNDSLKAGYFDFPTRELAERALLEAWPDGESAS